MRQKRGITADTALRLARYFGTTARFRMNMQLPGSWRWRKINWAMRYNVRRCPGPPELSKC